MKIIILSYTESRRKDSCVRSHVSMSMDAPAHILVEDTSISDGNNFRSSNNLFLIVTGSVNYYLKKLFI